MLQTFRVIRLIVKKNHLSRKTHKIERQKLNKYVYLFPSLHRINVMYIYLIPDRSRCVVGVWHQAVAQVKQLGGWIST